MKEENLQYLHGVGPKRVAVLASLGIHTIHDLFYYLPRNYLDRSHITKIKDLRRLLFADHDITVVGKVVTMDTIRRRGGGARFVLILHDESGSVDCVFFGGVQWFQKMFRVGEVLAVSGRPAIYGGRIQFVHPDFDRLSLDEEEETEIDWSNALNTGAIIPQYPSTEEARRARLDSRGFRRIIKRALAEKLSVISETLSKSLLDKHGLVDLQRAIRSIHFPPSWSNLEEARRRLKFDELFYLQLLLAYRKREVKLEQRGIAFNVTSKLARQLVDSLPFELTGAQKKVIREIANDLASPRPMNRLLQGDVGSGKTIVALIAMLIAIENGYQTAFMAPTEILSEQHFRTLHNFLQNIPVNVRLLIGGQRHRLRQDILEDVRRGSAQLVVGTHALIQEHVDFNQLGLVVIDEQHRFGVLQRAVLREKAVKSDMRPVHPDVLVMTATPIPRSLAMTVYGDLDVSVIDEMPQYRKPVRTLLKLDSEREQVYTFVRQEVAKGRQAYIVYPLIEESEKLDLQAATKSFEKLRDQVFPDLDLEIIHGRMPSDAKDEIMNDFKAGKIDILVATTVIEVGIDVPNATVMVIENAERFGLAQLHQLRGRVGRGSEQSYCVLVAKKEIFSAMSSRSALSEASLAGELDRRKAETRLQTILKTSDGFQIAEVDLKLRGPGEFFGTKQSGLPELRIADISADGELLKLARKEAFHLVADDPQLRLAENQPVRRHFVEKYKDQLALVKTG
ncbi:MAG: ATP-dependent DNA helicase RecG [Bacteroidota bacterium]